MVNKTRIKTDAGPPALGTYSQAIRTGDLVFVTAQTGRDPDTGKLEEGLEAQTRRMFSNLDAILNAAGCSAADIVKVTLWWRLFQPRINANWRGFLFRTRRCSPGPCAGSEIRAWLFRGRFEGRSR